MIMKNAYFLVKFVSEKTYKPIQAEKHRIEH